MSAGAAFIGSHSTANEYILLPFAIRVSLSSRRVDQGDQMSLKKKFPKNFPIHFWSKLKLNFYRGKKLSKN
jgi:hypothetical protein